MIIFVGWEVPLDSKRAQLIMSLTNPQDVLEISSLHREIYALCGFNGLCRKIRLAVTKHNTLLICLRMIESNSIDLYTIGHLSNEYQTHRAYYYKLLSAARKIGTSTKKRIKIRLKKKTSLINLSIEIPYIDSLIVLRIMQFVDSDTLYKIQFVNKLWHRLANSFELEEARQFQGPEIHTHV